MPLADTDRADERIDVFTGATGQDRREQVKRAFNAAPAKEPLRILICTDAAREALTAYSLQGRARPLAGIGAMPDPVAGCKHGVTSEWIA